MKRLILILFFGLGFVLGKAQITVNTPIRYNGGTLDAQSNISTLADTTTLSVSEGHLVHVNDIDQYYKWNGANWEVFVGAGGSQTATQIRDSLESLTGANRLDASAIQNLPSAAGADTVSNYTAFRSYTGGSQLISVVEPGVNGLFTRTGYIPAVDNGGTVIIDGNGVVWRRVAPDGVFLVDWFGAVGDGVTDDSNAIIAAMTQMTDPGTLIFSPGKTYLISKELDSDATRKNMKISGYGATIKRDAAIVARTTEITPDGQSFVLVDNPGFFEVGEEVVLLDTTTATVGIDYDSGNNSIEITEISGDTLKFGSGIDLPLGGNLDGAGEWYANARVIIDYPMLRISDVRDVTIEGLTFDGNAANNAFTRSWIYNHCIITMGGKSTIRDCRFNDVPNEVMFIRGETKIVGNYFENTQGSGVHVTNTESITPKILISGNVFVNTCLATKDINRHGEAAIVYSANSDSLIITNNNFRRSAGGGIGTASSVDEFLLISGNTFTNMDSFAIEFVSSQLGGAFGSHQLNVTNNLMDSCQAVYFTLGNGRLVDGHGFRNLTFTGNDMRNTRLEITETADAIISQNQLFFSEGFVDNLGETRAALLMDSNGGVVTVNRNIIQQEGESFEAGVVYNYDNAPDRIIDTSGYTTLIAYVQYHIDDNQIMNFRNGIDDLNVSLINRDFAYLGSTINGNTIIGKDTLVSKSWGINGNPGFEIAGNYIWGYNDATQLATDNTFIGILTQGVDTLLIDSLMGEWVHHNTIEGYAESIEVTDRRPLGSNYGFNVIVENNQYTGFLDNNTDPINPTNQILFNRQVKGIVNRRANWVRQNITAY